ncbi:unnamed protein product [Psylliodes chrysocephalus]|uniref:Cytochrome b5-related protein n=1 Tax=Psylliodes chrysocephalus TaxID=3402493 RepID=A0A9P0GFJ7_9CUCU|nr:unnamed protein product [Psylliodes chrysocephala]
MLPPDYVPKSSLGIVPPRSRFLGSLMTTDLWLEERRETDGAEGLWRIHDGLYNFESFVQEHPGGSEWLGLTKGTDISEAFESHHISQLPEQLLSKYFVRKAKTKRNIPFTFEENGFYKTLKKEIRKTLKNVPKDDYNTSDMYSDALFAGLILFSILSVRYWSYTSAVIAGVILGLLTGAGHNYIHRKDSFRMLYFQFSMFQVRDWRISHVLSHHLYPNTVIDLEVILPEPFLQYHPIKKLFGGYYSVIIAPAVFLFSFHAGFFNRLQTYKTLKPIGFTGLSLPLLMYIFGTETILNTFIMWNVILLVGSFQFTLIGFNAAHHHPDVFHDGDTPRSLDEYDWGLNQLDAVMDRKDITGSDFLVLTCFGDHSLHHLFPTLDHSILKHLYPTMKEVMNKFDVNLRMVTQWDAIVGGFQQLLKVKPNPLPPNLKSKKYLLL